jgi:hypothetical protein
LTYVSSTLHDRPTAWANRFQRFDNPSQRATGVPLRVGHSTNLRAISPLHFVGVYISEAFQNRKHKGARPVATVLLIKTA